MTRSISVSATLFEAIAEHGEVRGLTAEQVTAQALRLFLIRIYGDNYGPGRIERACRGNVHWEGGPNAMGL
jgi:hypothetical protein